MPLGSLVLLAPIARKPWLWTYSLCLSTQVSQRFNSTADNANPLGRGESARWVFSIYCTSSCTEAWNVFILEQLKNDSGSSMPRSFGNFEKEAPLRPYGIEHTLSLLELWWRQLASKTGLSRACCLVSTKIYAHNLRQNRGLALPPSRRKYCLDALIGKLSPLYK